MTDLLAAVQSAWRAHTQTLKPDREMREPRDHVWASSRKPCARWMALDLLHPEEASAWDADGKERAIRGDERERALRVRLDLAGQIGGFSVIEQQQYLQIRDRDGTPLITGKKEGAILFNGSREKITFEIKSGRLAERADSLADLDGNFYSRSYVDQLLTYLYAEDRRYGFFLLDHPGEPAWIWVDLYQDDHLERAESFLREARAAVDARFGRAELPAMTEDRSVCRRCPHLGRSCHPPIEFTDEVQVLDAESEPELCADVELVHLQGETAKQVEKAEKRIKARLRGAETVLVDGRLMIKGRWQKRTVAPKDEDLPPELAAKRAEVEAELDKLKKPIDKGAWLWEVISLGDSNVTD